MKRNGFCLPLHYLQVGAWVVLVLLGSVFYIAVSAEQERRTSIVLMVLYSSSLITTLCSGFICTKVDPTDLAVQVKLGKSVSKYDYSQFPRLCIKCSTHVGSRSKHCHKCDRCAAEFDHHCDWLNNCIGKGNYRWFVVLIVSLQVCVLIELAVCLAQIKIISEDEKNAQELRAHFDFGDAGYVYTVTLITVAGLCTATFTSNGYLILFHCYLALKHKTTYEYILQRRAARPQIVPASISQQSPDENSVFRFDLPVTDSRPIVPHCSPVGAKVTDVKCQSESPANMAKLVPVRVDVSSMPSFVEQPTELEFGPGYNQRKAREESVTPGQEQADNFRSLFHTSPANST